MNDMPASKKRRRPRFFLGVLLLVLYFTLLYIDIDAIPFLQTVSQWNLILVNSDNAIPDNWEASQKVLSNGRSVDTRVYPYLQQMFDDMRSQNVWPIVSSGYRTAEKQQALMDEKIQDFISQGYTRSAAETEARKWVSAVGHSEHQTGLALDINADASKSSSSQQVYNWLAENAWKYGFILRYPADKTDITHIDYEPWHYRYVGTEAAAEIYAEGICLEEYIERQNEMDQKPFSLRSLKDITRNLLLFLQKLVKLSAQLLRKAASYGKQKLLALFAA